MSRTKIRLRASARVMGMAAGLGPLLGVWLAAVGRADMPMPTPMPISESRAFQTVAVADGVLAFIAAETSGPIPSGNVVAVIGQDAVLVVDSGRFPTLARRMIAEIRKKTDKPIRYLVHTHWHLDHIAADAAFREAYPDLTFVATEFTRRRILDKQVAYVRDLAKNDAQYAAGLREYLQGGKRRDGSPIPEDFRAYLQQEVSDIDLEIAEVGTVAVVAPTLTFQKELTVHLGGREVRVAFLGKGNTAGDAVVVVPDARVVVTGDLLVAPTPYGYGCHPADWIATLRALSSLDAAVIVPGHGPVMHDWSYALKVSRLLEEVRSQVGEAERSGATLDEARQKVDLSEFRRQFAGSEFGWQQAFDDFFVASAVERAYQEAKGTMAEE